MTIRNGRIPGLVNDRVYYDIPVILQGFIRMYGIVVDIIEFSVSKDLDLKKRPAAVLIVFVLDDPVLGCAEVSLICSDHYAVRVRVKDRTYGKKVIEYTAVLADSFHRIHAHPHGFFHMELPRDGVLAFFRIIACGSGILFQNALLLYDTDIVHAGLPARGIFFFQFLLIIIDLHRGDIFNTDRFRRLSAKLHQFSDMIAAFFIFNTQIRDIRKPGVVMFVGGLHPVSGASHIFLEDDLCIRTAVCFTRIYIISVQLSERTGLHIVFGDLYEIAAASELSVNSHRFAVHVFQLFITVKRSCGRVILTIDTVHIECDTVDLVII